MMELKKYALNKKNEIIDVENEYVFETKSEPTTSNFIKDLNIIATSDNLLELAREGDLVNYNGKTYELYKYDGFGCINPINIGDLWFGLEFTCYNEIPEIHSLKEHGQYITMLYKKVGNDYIGYEVN